MPARTLRPARIARRAVMAVYSALGNVISLLQRADKSYQRLHLPPRRPSLCEIPNQTDANPTLVGPVSRRAPTVSPRDLLSPPERNLHLPVAAAVAVTDDEIVAHTVPVIALLVPSVKYGCASLHRRGVVYDYG